MSKVYWLLLEKSDQTRVSKGIDSYNDTTGVVYNYDSLVPNYKNIHVGDIVIIRKENIIDGMGIVVSISSDEEVSKIHRRCPKCKTTDVRQRKHKAPKWKCGRCGLEFESAVCTNMNVTAFQAAIDEYRRFDTNIDVRIIKSCAVGNSERSQLSMIALDPTKLEKIIDIGQSRDKSSYTKARGQGRGLTQIEKQAVEKRAMVLAKELYENAGWKVTDVSTTQSFDLVAVKELDIRFIEVKGTTGTGESVILTRNEVDHAKMNPNKSSLVVVSNIKLLDGDTPEAQGGLISYHASPWEIDDDKLNPTQYMYEI